MTDNYTEVKEIAKAVKDEAPAKVTGEYEGAVVREEEMEVDDPVPLTYKKIQEKELDPSTLKPDEKMLVIKYLREDLKMTQDAIAEELGVSRRTVINYCNKIKKINAQKLSDMSSWEIGGDIYQKSLEAMEGALAKGKYQQFAYVVSTLVSTLQSMGLVFKVPKQSQVQQQIMADLQVRGAEGFKQLKNAAEENDEINIDNVFDEIMGAVKEGKLEDKNGNKTNG